MGLRDITYDKICEKLRNDFFDNVHLIGLENITENTENGIIVANHSDNYKRNENLELIRHRRCIDHLLIAPSLRKEQRVRGLVYKEMFKHPLIWVLLTTLKQIRASRKDMVENSKKIIECGEYPLIFPEGPSHLMKIDQQKKIYGGLGLLVYHLDNPTIFPMNISIRGKVDSWYPNFKSANLVFGESFNYLGEFGEYPRKGKRVDYQKITQKIMDEKVYSL
jgi:hypothetical protein